MAAKKAEAASVPKAAVSLKPKQAKPKQAGSASRSVFNLKSVDSELESVIADTSLPVLGASAVDGIVTLVDGQPVTTTLAIAEGVDVDHASVIKLVRTYLADLEEFGIVAFETLSQAQINSGFEIQNSQGSDLKSNPSGAGRPTEYATLNEPQSTLLLTYMRNSDIVRGFKKRLVKAFFELARQARSGNVNPSALSRLQLIEMALHAERGRLELAGQNAALVGQNAELVEQKAVVVEKLAIAAPKANALDQIATADGSICISNAAKLVGLRRDEAFSWLSNHGWIFRRGGVGQWVAKDDKRVQGLLVMKVNTIEVKDGRERNSLG